METRTGHAYISCCLCSRGIAAHLAVTSTVLWSEPDCCTQRKWGTAGATGSMIREGEVAYYLSMTAHMSQIHHSVQTTWGNCLVPTITNQGISPVNNLMMWLKRSTEHAHSACVSVQARGMSATADIISWGHVKMPVVDRTVQVHKTVYSKPKLGK